MKLVRDSHSQSSRNSLKEPYAGNSGPGGLGRYPAGGRTPPSGAIPDHPKFMGYAIATTHEMNAMSGQDRIQENLVGPNHEGVPNEQHIKTHSSHAEDKQPRTGFMERILSGFIGSCMSRLQGRKDPSLNRLQFSEVHPGTSETGQVWLLPRNGQPYDFRKNPLVGLYGKNNPDINGNPVGPGQSDGKVAEIHLHMMAKDAAVVSHTHPWSKDHLSFIPSHADLAASLQTNERSAQIDLARCPPTHIIQTPAPLIEPGRFGQNEYIRYDGRTYSYVKLIPNPYPGTGTTPPPQQGFNFRPCSTSSSLQVDANSMSHASFSSLSDRASSPAEMVSPPTASGGVPENQKAPVRRRGRPSIFIHTKPEPQ